MDKFKNVTSIANKVINEVERHIIGQKDLVEQVVICIFSGGNVLLEGVPGLGKTKLVTTLGKVLGLDFKRIQFTPDLMPADITGTNIFDRSHETGFTFQKGPVFTNIVLADEINRATPKTQSALLEAMQEKTVTVGGQSYILPKPYFVLATQNPIEQEGTYPLPEAQMDRFMFKLNVAFPELSSLKKIVGITTGVEPQQFNTVTNASEILKVQNVAKEVPIADAVLDFAMKIITATHPNSEYAPEEVKKYVKYGSSPRGAQGLISSARVKALMEDRYNVAFDDIKKMAYPILRHRIMLNFEGISEGYNQDSIVNIIINSIKE